MPFGGQLDVLVKHAFLLLANPNLIGFNNP